MPRTDAFGIQHITTDDQVTDQGLDHVEACNDCAQQFPTALWLAQARRPTTDRAVTGRSVAHVTRGGAA